MGPLLTRDELRGLLAELAARLERRGARASIYVVGGAAMALVFDERRSTRDVDSVILEGHGPLTEEVRAIGRARGLPGSWLNDQVAMYVSMQPDPGRQIVFDHANLSVSTASAERLLAMKLIAARGSDVDDIRTLLTATGLTSVAGAQELLALAFPGQPLSDRARLIVEDILARP